jgi:hypothetical protein
MKKALFLLLIVPLLLICCNKKSTVAKQTESAKINSVSIIIDDNLWNGAIGDSLRNKFASPVIGLPQEEPLFTINQYPLKLLEGYVADSRNIIVIKKEDSGAGDYFKITENQYATPQTVVSISGKTTAGILDLIEKHAPEIISRIRSAEIAENQRQIRESEIKDDKIVRKFRISVDIPVGYRFVFQRRKFLWLKKGITSGSTSLLIYEIPQSAIHNKSDIVSSIIRVRDSIGRKYIHGTRQQTNMVTENSYTPYFLNTAINGKTTYETRGTWELNNDFMSGPFVNYWISDPANKRFLVLEGFCYAPSREKRDLMFELEAIMKSANFTIKNRHGPKLAN